MYLADVVEDDNQELPRGFTEAVTLSVFIKDRTIEYVNWSDFVSAFPMAVRQRKVLWESFQSQKQAVTDVCGA